MDVLIEIINASLNVYILYLFYSLFWDRNKSNLVLYVLCVISGSIQVCALLFMKGHPIMFLINFLISLSVAFLFNSKFVHKVIYALIYFAVGSIIEMVVAFVINSMFNVNFVEGKQGAPFITGMLISKFVFVIVIMIIKSKKHSPLIKKMKIRYFTIFLFPIATLIIEMAQHGIFLKNPDQPLFTMCLVIIGYALLIIANMIVFDFMDSIYTNTVNEGKIITANEIIQSQKEQYIAMIDHNSHIAKIQHDNKHLFLGLLSEMKRGNYDVVMNGLSEACEICGKDIVMDNSIIESIVNIKSREACEKGISVDYENRNLREITISPVDIAIVLGNALDNAIEACEKIDTYDEKIVYLYVALKGDTLVISIKNPVINNININNLESNKDDKMLHGFGVISMKQIATKYNGEVLFKCENNVFNTTIVLINPR